MKADILDISGKKTKTIEIQSVQDNFFSFFIQVNLILGKSKYLFRQIT